MQGFLLLTVCAAVSPIEKVLQLLGDLEGKIIKDGDAQQKIYEEFSDYCNDNSKEAQREIAEGKKAAERFSATIADSAAEISALETKIGDLGSSIASDEKDLKDATAVREKEHADFLEGDKDLSETVSMISRAIAIIEKEMSSSPSLLQEDSMDKVSQALQALVNAPAVDALSKERVSALLQADDEQPAGAPAAAAYENKSGGILGTLEDMLEKAQAQQSEAQKAEMTAAHNFAMLKQGLEDASGAATKELDASKKGKAGAEETKAEAEGELERTNTELAADTTRLKDLKHECSTKAEEYDLDSREIAAELEALAMAKKIIQEKTGAASDRTYGSDDEAASFVQVSTTSRTRALSDKLVALLQGIAKDNKATELAQLALKVRSVMASNADPFKKVKGMIQEMVEKLIKEAQEEAGKKAFCDKEMSETKAKMEDKQSEVNDLNTDKDKFEAKIAKLTEAIASLEQELADIAAAQRKANEMRAAEKDAWGKAKTDFEQGLEGVQMALQVLRDYYAKKDDAAPALIQGDLRAQMALVQSKAAKSDGAAGGIIGMLEVAESDFSKMLSEGQASEDQLQKEYETVTEDNRISTAKKETEAKYSAKDKKETQALLANTKDDMGTSQEELGAILEYWEKLQPQCVAKPEPYEERKARREKEIAGLKEALEILEAESAPSFLAMRAA